MQSIEISDLVGHPPFSITVCDITYSYCYFVISGVTSSSITITPPNQLNGVNQLLVVITDSKGCDTINYINCFTPTPTPTPTITPTITPTNISCNCIAFINVGSGNLNFGYTQCNGTVFNGVIPQSTTFYFCGKQPFADVNVIISINDICINNSCQTSGITPTPTQTPTPTITSTQTQTPTYTPTNTVTPTSTYTPTPTPTQTNIIVDCTTYLLLDPANVSKYDVVTNVLTPLSFPSPISASDIANSYGKFWLVEFSSPYSIIEYSIIPTPFSAVYSKTLYPPVDLYALAVKDNTTLISTTLSVSPLSAMVVEVDVSGPDLSTAIVVDKFLLPGTDRALSGDLFYFPTTDKLFVTSQVGFYGDTYLTQFDYTTGDVDHDILLSPDINGVYGLSAKDEFLYLFEDTGKVYRVDSMSVPTFTLVQTTVAGIYAASSDVSCLIYPSPTPTMTQTPTPTSPILYYAHPLSVGYENNFTVCSDNFQSITAFTSNELISQEDTLYTNQELNDILVGGLLYYKNLLEGNYIRVRDAGTVELIGSCT